MPDPLSPKQVEFISNSVAHWNLAHGAVSTGKTVCTLIRFMQACLECPDNQIFMVGHSSDTIYQNAIRLLLEAEEMAFLRPFCTWQSGKRILRFKDKVIQTLGAKDEGAIKKFQGLSASLIYCDEMTLYPEVIIDMIDTRLRRDHSMGFSAMNPANPSHKCKQWIDKAIEGDPNYYQLHFVLDDNPFLPQHYKDRVKASASGLFYKRNILGLWCLAEGAIFDMFDRKLHVVNKPPRCADYFICSIDFGSSNAFAALVIGVYTGMRDQTGKCLWVENEFYWDSKKMDQQLTNDTFADRVQQLIEPYGIRSVYIDPSALSMKIELRKRGMAPIDGDNDVYNGIQTMTSEMSKGNLFIMKNCVNLIREIEGYVWDSKKSQRGDDEPVKKADHACVTGDTLITVINYRQKPIQELAEMVRRQASFKNYCVNSGKIESDTYYNPTLTRERAEIFELELEDGTILKATGDHQILTQRGFVELRQLMLCDTVMTCNIKHIMEKNST